MRLTVFGYLAETEIISFKSIMEYYLFTYSSEKNIFITLRNTLY